MTTQAILKLDMSYKHKNNSKPRKPYKTYYPILVIECHIKATR